MMMMMMMMIIYPGKKDLMSRTIVLHVLEKYVSMFAFLCNNVRVWNNRMLIILKNVADDHNPSFFGIQRFLYIFCCSLFLIQSHQGNCKISKQNIFHFIKCSPSSSLAMLTYLHYKRSTLLFSSLCFPRSRIRFGSCNMRRLNQCRIF